MFNVMDIVIPKGLDPDICNHYRVEKIGNDYPNDPHMLVRCVRHRADGVAYGWVRKDDYELLPCPARLGYSSQGH